MYHVSLGHVLHSILLLLLLLLLLLVLHRCDNGTGRHAGCDDYVLRYKIRHLRVTNGLAMHADMHAEKCVSHIPQGENRTFLGARTTEAFAALLRITASLEKRDMYGHTWDTREQEAG
jgi:hypothetical protein